jgi:hypothetical protein
MPALCEYPVPVTRWVKDRNSIQFCVDDLKKGKVAFAVAKRNDEYSVWRELLSDDPEDLIAEKAPEFFVERYGEVGPVPELPKSPRRTARAA